MAIDGFALPIVRCDGSSGSSWGLPRLSVWRYQLGCHSRQACYYVSHSQHWGIQQIFTMFFFQSTKGSCPRKASPWWEVLNDKLLCSHQKVHSALWTPWVYFRLPKPGLFPTRKTSMVFVVPYPCMSDAFCTMYELWSRNTGNKSYWAIDAFLWTVCEQHWCTHEHLSTKRGDVSDRINLFTPVVVAK